MTETSSESPGPGAGGGTHSHTMDQFISPVWRGVMVFVTFLVLASLIGLTLTITRQATRNGERIADSNRLTEEGFDCVVAQLGEHRINSARAEQANAETLGYAIPRDDRVAPPNPEQLANIEESCMRFFAEQERQQEAQDARGESTP